MDNQCILDTIPFKLESQSTKQRLIYLVFGIIGFVLIVIIACLSANIITKSQQRNLISPTLFAPNGFLKVNSKLYVNVDQRIFSDHESNFSLSLSVSTTPRTIWSQIYNNTRTQFLLKTEINGHIYTCQCGPPGAGAKWGIAFVAPATSPVNTDIVFNSDWNPMNDPWPDGYKYLKIDDDTKYLFWTDNKSLKIKNFNIVQQ